MKFAILLATGLSALALSGCGEERRGYGGGYGYERSTIVVGEGRDHRRDGRYREARRDGGRHDGRGHDDRRNDRGDRSRGDGRGHDGRGGDGRGDFDNNRR